MSSTSTTCELTPIERWVARRQRDNEEAELALFSLSLALFHFALAESDFPGMGIFGWIIT